MPVFFDRASRMGEAIAPLDISLRQILFRQIILSTTVCEQKISVIYIYIFIYFATVIVLFFTIIIFNRLNIIVMAECDINIIWISKKNDVKFLLILPTISGSLSVRLRHTICSLLNTYLTLSALAIQCTCFTLFFIRKWSNASTMQLSILSHSRGIDKDWVE